VSDSTILTSKRGYYEVKQHRAHFEDSVRIDNPNFALKADSLDYDTQSEIAYFLGPTEVFNPDKKVYCEDGFYDTKRNYAALYQNAQFENYEDGKEEIAKGDTILYDGQKDEYFLIGHAFYQNETQEVYADTIYIDNKRQKFSFVGHPRFISRDSTEGQSIDAAYSFYDEKTKRMLFRERVRIRQETQLISCDSLDYNIETKEGWAQGAVVWEDTAAKVQIQCEEAFYNDSTKFLLAHRQPILRSIIDADTLWLRADTLWSFPDTTFKNTRNINAYHDVRIYKSDLQVRCDSLYYNGLDSTFQFYQNPILWVDATQFTADTIHVQLKQNRIHKVWLFQASFIVNTNDLVYFNQIKGTDVETSFKEGDLHKMSVYDAGETVYYALDEQDRYVGVNDVDCRDMHLFFEQKTVRSIRFEDKPAAVLYPMHQVDHSNLRLAGFQWHDSLRIRSKEALFYRQPPKDTIDPLSFFQDSSSTDTLDIDGFDRIKNQRPSNNNPPPQKNETRTKEALKEALEED
jgi:lipopolysaccharide export system protein LptA